MTTTPSSIPSRIPEAPAAPLWLKMLRAAGLGLRPERVLIAMVAMVIIAGLIRTPLPWEASQSLLSLWQSAFGRAGLWSWSEPSRALSQFATFAADHAWAMLAVGTPAAFVVMAAMATIARMAAVELATGELVPAKRAFRLVSARFGHPPDTSQLGRIDRWLTERMNGRAHQLVVGVEVPSGLGQVRKR